MSYYALITNVSFRTNYSYTDLQLLHEASHVTHNNRLCVTSRSVSSEKLGPDNLSSPARFWGSGVTGRLTPGLVTGGGMQCRLVGVLFRGHGALSWRRALQLLGHGPFTFIICPSVFLLSVSLSVCLSDCLHVFCLSACLLMHQLYACEFCCLYCLLAVCLVHIIC